MLHLHHVSRRSRLGAVVLVAMVLAAGCTDSDVNSSGSKQHTATTATTPGASADSTGSAPATTGEQTSDDDLPQLDDVTTAPWEPETRTDELAVAIGETDLTPQQAVDAFALLYPDMPGATPSDLPPGPGLDATYTWMLIRAVRDLSLIHI